MKSYSCWGTLTVCRRRGIAGSYVNTDLFFLRRAPLLLSGASHTFLPLPITILLACVQSLPWDSTQSSTFYTNAGRLDCYEWIYTIGQVKAEEFCCSA